MINSLESANTALQGHAIVEKLERDGFLSEWYVVLNTMCDGDLAQ